MRKSFGLLCLVPAALFAEDTQGFPSVPAPVVISSSAVQTSTAASVAVTGETVLAPRPNSMTQPAGPGVFVTLTRTPISRERLPAHAEVIIPSETRAFDAQTAGDMVSREAGIHTLPIGRFGSVLTARMRGAPSSQTLVMIDGRPAAGFALGVPDLSEIPIELIERIEVVRGGASSVYGPNAVGGVINVITKRAAYTGLPISHVAWETGSYGRQILRLDFGSRRGPIDFFFYGNQQRESGFRDNSDVRQYNIGGNLGWGFGKAGKWLIDIGSFHSNNGVPGPRCDTTDPYCAASPPEVLTPHRFNNKDEKIASSPGARQETDTTYLRSSYLVSLPHDMDLSLRAFGQEREVSFDASGNPNAANVSRSLRRERSKGGEAQVDLPLGFSVGGSFIRDHEDFKDRLTDTDTFQKQIENWGSFVQWTAHKGDFTLIPSGRYDKNSQFGDTLNPRVHGLWDATEWLRWSATAARSFRAPTIDEVTPLPTFHYLGNNDLRPEKAWTYDAGFELHRSSRSLRVNYFRANVGNLIQTFVAQNPSDPSSPFVAVNLGHARRQGFETIIDHVFSDRWSHRLNYTYLENVGSVSGSAGTVLLAYSPRHNVNHLLTFRPRIPWRIDSTVRFLDKRYSANNRAGTKMASQVTWDLRFAYQWRQTELYLGVMNVTNKRYVEQPGFPLPGTNFFGGISLRLWG